MQNLNILVLDDEKRITEELSEFLKRKKFNCFEANKVADAFRIMEAERIDILILDIRLKEFSGLDVLEDTKDKYPETEVIMITGHGDMTTVIESMRLGAIDFLNKPFRPTEVKIAIERTAKFIRLQQELKSAENRNSLISMELGKNIEREFIGESNAIKQVLELSLNVARYNNVNVMITGESGTGKEIIARIIHFASGRKSKNFFPVNCSAIPESLMESEFFGHRKGSFTGALSNKKGFFEITDGGTLFLDEIADMPVNLQAKLLRVIEEKKIKRIGEEQEFSVDVRIVAATNHNIEKLVVEGKFRLDLYHRLNTMIIQIPPLRERTEDIKPLLEHFILDFSRKLKIKPLQIHNNLLPELKKYDFPGNVRELKNLTERAMIICKSTLLSKDCFPLKCISKPLLINEEKNYNLEQNEIELIKSALQKTNNNQTKAAKLLGISRNALIRRMNRFEIK